MSAASVSVAVREHPILFSGPMVRAILDGRKTQTRRVVKPSPSLDPLSHDYAVRAMVGHADDLPGKPFGVSFVGDRGLSNHQRCPYGVPGDRLWVRETWSQPGGDLRYRADDEARAAENNDVYAWSPSIHMPRSACRLTLEVTEFRVQRLQDITADDVVAEGTPLPGPLASPADLEWFRRAWDAINGKRAPWSSNPWVWAITFKRVA